MNTCPGDDHANSFSLGGGIHSRVVDCDVLWRDLLRAVGQAVGPLWQPREPRTGPHPRGITDSIAARHTTTISGVAAGPFNIAGDETRNTADSAGRATAPARHSPVNIRLQAVPTRNSTRRKLTHQRADMHDAARLVLAHRCRPARHRVLVRIRDGPDYRNNAIERRNRMPMQATQRSQSIGRMVHAITERLHRTGLPAKVLMAAVLLVLFFRMVPGAAAQPAMLDETAKLSACRSEALKLLHPAEVDIDLLTQISNLCYGQVRGEDLLGDFNIRRTNYLRQQFQGVVFLWMVVTITISGVVLAALQLAAAYKLASSGRGDLTQGGEITIEEKRISLKSSVTGLLILTVSFAFFLVYVVWVYPLTASNIENPEAPRPTVPVLPMLGPGGIGPPPQAKPNSATAPQLHPTPADSPPK